MIQYYYYECVGSKMKHSTSHTILPSGKSVEDCLQCLEDTEKRTLAIKESKKQLLDDFHDDFCVYCGVGGDLVCCETCPVTCHHGCAGLELAPENSINEKGFIPEE